VMKLLPAGGGPVIATSDYLKTVPDLISRWVPDGLLPLGTDGYGLSDTRKALRRYFEIDSAAIVVASLSILARRGEIDVKIVKNAVKDLGVDPNQADPRDR